MATFLCVWDLLLLSERDLLLPLTERDLLLLAEGVLSLLTERDLLRSLLAAERDLLRLGDLEEPR